MSDIKQVKVDNWGIYFLQRLKHFFNRTDYCDLTLQFQDNAQLKVHRLVLSACTEYFELLERTCEMYEDCLVMPDDLQADVVVPIVNFMYTGQLDFKPELLEKLYHTSQVMNMPVLTKLLEAHRTQPQRIQIPAHDFRNVKSYSKSLDTSKQSKSSAAVASTSYMPSKRSYSKAFNNVSSISKIKKPNVAKPIGNKERPSSNGSQQSFYPEHEHPIVSNKNQIFKDPRPTRYELPEELDVDNVFESSFTNISYTSTPLMVHPETVKRYSSKKNANFEDGSNPKRFIHSSSTMDIVECKKISPSENIFDDEVCENGPDDIFASISVNSKDDQKDANQLFDQILDSDSQKSNTDIQEMDRSKPKLDHAKIISEVLKKYPHLMKSNKNIKLKILNTPNKGKKSRSMSTAFNEEKEIKPKVEPPDFTYETDVIDSKQAAKLIAMGAENIKGPWICLICGTPGRALHFTSYYKFRRHLVDVHNEKPIPNFCEYCGLKSLKRNYSFHHLYTKHGIPPPPHYNFPKCNYCNYIALTEAYLVKHKLSHIENRNFGCNVCAASFNSSNQLLVHIQKTGHKYSADRKVNLQCIYCFKTFSRQTNLYTHLKVNHKESAAKDGIIEDSDDEKHERAVKDRSEKIKTLPVKYEIPVTFENEYENIDVQYQIEQNADGNIHILPKTPQTIISSAKHKILNPGFNSPLKSPQKSKAINNVLKSEFLQESPISLVNQNDGVIVVDGNEYIVKDNQLIPKNQIQSGEEYLLTNVISESEHGDDNSIQTTSIDFPAIQCNDTEEPKSVLKKASNIGSQHIQIVVSNEEEYKALMSANHSIIFDDGDPNKTLTVLTAPQNSSLGGAAIDLDSRQTNDMMIIQEEYPLNVTETPAVENPNIVVVYSHPVDDQNKQFQYITSQGIEAQFIQSSAMITHNYETVTTSTPVMSAHVMDTHIEETWPNNVKEGMETMAIETQVNQTEAQGIPEQSFQNSMNPVEDISLPKTDITTIVNDEKTVNETIALPTLNEPHEPKVKGIDQILEQEGIKNPSTKLDVNAANEQLVHKEIQTENVNYDSIVMRHLENKDSTETNLSTEKSNDNSNILQKIFDESTVSTDVSTTTMSITNSSDVLHDKIRPQEPDEGISNIVQALTSNTDITVSKVAPQQIQNLTSEWTENDLEKELSSDVSMSVNTSSQISSIMTVDADGSVYMEESIENIQQEMAKQMEAIESENKSMLPLIETETVTAIAPPNAAQEELNKEEVITETSMQVPNVKTDSTPISKTSDMSIVNATQVNRSMPSLTMLPEVSNSDTTTVSSVVNENSVGNTDLETVRIDQKIVTNEENISKNVEIKNAIPDLLEQTPKTPVESAKPDDKKCATAAIEEETPSEQHTVITLNKIANEKISSLLNDWEDNDSQQDSTREEDNKSEANAIEEKDDATPKEVTPEKVNLVPNNDNIKSLVSDWDDEDDEGK